MKRVLLVTACVTLLIAPVVEAKQGKTKKVTFGPVITRSALGNTAIALAGQPSSATATCPKGTQAVGGGFQLPSSPGDQMTVEQSFRSSKRAWAVTGIPLEGSPAATAFAYCRKTNAKIKDVEATGVIPGTPGGSGAATASCPKGTQIIGGGFESTRGPAAPNVTTTETSIRAANGWNVQAINNTGPPQTLTAHAYCAKGVKRKSVRVTRSQDAQEEALVTSSSPACPTAKNPKKTRRLSAGGFATPVGDFAAVVPLVAESRIVGSNWVAAAIANSNPGVLPVTSFGICL